MSTLLGLIFDLNKITKKKLAMRPCAKTSDITPSVQLYSGETSFQHSCPVAGSYHQLIFMFQINAVRMSVKLASCCLLLLLLVQTAISKDVKVRVTTFTPLTNQKDDINNDEVAETMEEQVMKEPTCSAAKKGEKPHINLYFLSFGEL